MNYLVYDTETSGLNFNRDEVLQFSGILLDDSLAIKQVFNFYCDTQVSIDPGAAAVNGLNHSILRELSGGKTFEDNFLNLPIWELKDLCWVGYNSVHFDSKMINSTLVANNLPPVVFGPEEPRIKLTNNKGIYQLDMMKFIQAINKGHRMKLISAVDTIKDKYPIDVLNNAYKKYFSQYDINPKGDLFHNALYDTFMTYALLCYYAPYMRY